MRLPVALSGALLAGCSSVTTLSGAKTLEPGQLEFVGALSVNQNTDPTSSALVASGQGLPVGIFADLGGRIGVVPDLDVGWRVYTAGVGADARLRFYRDRRLHLAVAPGLVFSGIPTKDFSVGLAEIRAPLLAELEITRGWSVGLGAHLFLRDVFQTQAVTGLEGTGDRMTVHTLQSVRTEVHGRNLGVALGFELMEEPARRAPLGWNLSLQLVLRTDPVAVLLRRSARRPVPKTPSPEPSP